MKQIKWIEKTKNGLVFGFKCKKVNWNKFIHELIS